MQRDTKRRIAGGAGLLVLTALALYVVAPDLPPLTIGSFRRDFTVKLGLDLQGGAHLVYDAAVEEIQTENPEDALAGVRDVIERRVNAFGVGEPLIQTNQFGQTYRVIVELPGVFDIDEAIRRIGETPQLDFRKEIDPSKTPVNIDESGIVDTEAFFERTDLSGEHLQQATVTFDQLSGFPQVELDFNREGTKIFANLTKENIGKRIAIYLDGVPISAPVVQTEITNGKAVITGGFSIEEARQLARRLNAGALPVPIKLVGQQRIGPTLGQTAIEHSITAGIIGFGLVMIWMISFYRLPGVVASVALLLYALYFFALIKLIPITLTLAGIAGFILSIGMAVDANVLIFERFRENLRGGKGVPFALRDGFHEAWSAIQASNVSSIMTAVILYIFGTSVVRGFALTFALGIILSMFTAITVSRGLLTVLLTQSLFRKPFLLGAEAKTKGGNA